MLQIFNQDVFPYPQYCLDLAPSGPPSEFLGLKEFNSNEEDIYAVQEWVNL